MPINKPKVEYSINVEFNPKHTLCWKCPKCESWNQIEEGEHEELKVIYEEVEIEVEKAKCTSCELKITFDADLPACKDSSGEVEFYEEGINGGQ